MNYIVYISKQGKYYVLKEVQNQINNDDEYSNVL